MRINRAVRAILLSVLIVLGSFTIFSMPNVSASDSGQRTELYFSPYRTLISDILFADDGFDEFDDFDEFEDDFFDFFGDGMFGAITSKMSTFRPADEQESVWPPSLYSHIDKPLDRVNISNINPSFIEFLIMWAIYNNPQFLIEFAQEEPFLLSIIEKIDFELVNPFRINQDFTYQGKEPVELNDNIIFDLYLEAYPKFLFPDGNILERGGILQRGFFRNDYVKAVLSKTESIFGFPVISREIKNVTTPIKRANPLNSNIGENIIKQQIVMDLSNDSIVINPGDTLRFSVELIHLNKTIRSWFFERKGIINEWRTEEAIYNRIFKIFERWNASEGQLRKPIGESVLLALESLESFLDEMNTNISITDIITFNDLTNIGHGLRGSSFFFASSSYPSRVILPVDLTVEDENIKTFYLHEGNIMDEVAPQSSDSNIVPLHSTDGFWNTSTIPRNKIVKEATAAIYIDATNFRILPNKPILTFSLLSGGEILANESIQIEEKFFKNRNSANEPFMISFKDINKEIFYGDTISLAVSISNKPSINFGFFYSFNLLYDSFDYPSAITVTFDETDNIQFQINADPENQYIIPGGEITYSLDVSSVYDDDIYLDISDSKRGQWSYSVVEDIPVSVSAGETKTITIIAKSENDKKAAYGDYLDLTFELSGRTGYEKKTTTVVVDSAAVEYNIGLIGQEGSKDIKKGSSGTFYFIVENKNTGAVDDEDSYSIQATSKNNWEIRYTDSTPRLVIGEKTDARRVFVRVYVPKNTTLTSDVITFTAVSNANPSVSKTMNVTVNVKELSIFEYLYQVFDSVAKRIGIDNMFGGQAVYALVGGGVLVLLLLVSIVIFLLKKKFLKIMCNNRVLEIDPSKEAIFTIILFNTTRKTRMYKISSQVKTDPSKWSISSDAETISIPALSKKEVTLFVKADQSVEPEDWAEINTTVEVVGKRKTQDVTTMVMIKQGKTILRIKDVFTWPKVFERGDRMITSCIVENKGTISARNIEVVLLINRKQKNKVQVTIPPEGFADIKLPWIALKGKNDVELKIKE